MKVISKSTCTPNPELVEGNFYLNEHNDLIVLQGSVRYNLFNLSCGCFVLRTPKSKWEIKEILKNYTYLPPNTLLEIKI